MSDFLYKAFFRYQIPIAALFLLPAASYYLGFALPESFISSKTAAVLLPRAVCDVKFLASFPGVPIAVYLSSLLLTVMASIAFLLVAILLALHAPVTAASFGLNDKPKANILGTIVLLLLFGTAAYFFLTAFGTSSADRSNCSWFGSLNSFEPSDIYDKLILAGVLAATAYTCAYTSFLLFLHKRSTTSDPASQ